MTFSEINISQKYTFHVLGIHNTATSLLYSGSAYTKNVMMMCEILTKLGHTVIHYGNWGSNPICTEHVEILTKEEMEQIYNGIDLNTTTFDQIPDTFKSEFSQRTIQQVFARKTKDLHFMLGFWGDIHKEIWDYTQRDCIYVEPCVGSYYSASKHRVFPSYSNMHVVSTKEGKTQGSWYDAVIPHAVHKHTRKPQSSKGYLLYLGRITEDKGLQLAINISNTTNTPLKIVGQGDISRFKLSSLQTYEGYITDQNSKLELISNAKALIAPSYYFEPFGLNIIEALSNGTPCITTDWGSFPELIIHGENGYRCRTHDDFINAISKVDELDRLKIQNHALETYSYESIAIQYQEYFDNLYQAYVEHKWDISSQSNSISEYKNKNISIKIPRELVIYNPYTSGFGDMLFYTPIPRIAKESGMYDKVYVSTRQEYRYHDHRELLWDLNPFVDGYVDRPASEPRSITFQWDRLDWEQGETACDRISDKYGLPRTGFGLSPELYYDPKVIEKLKGKTLFDPNSHTFNTNSSILSTWLLSNVGVLDYYISPNPAFSQHVELPKENWNELLTIESTFDYIDAIYSCDKFYCRFSGGSILAGIYGTETVSFYSKKDRFLDTFAIWRSVKGSVQYVKI